MKLLICSGFAKEYSFQLVLVKNINSTYNKGEIIKYEADIFLYFQKHIGRVSQIYTTLENVIYIRVKVNKFYLFYFHFYFYLFSYLGLRVRICHSCNHTII